LLPSFFGTGRHARCSKSAQTQPQLAALVAIAGAVGFAFGICVFAFWGASWIVTALTATSAPIGALLAALPFGLGAAAIAGLFVNNRRRKQTRLFRAALNNMTQGLCMFDSAARLVLCNQVYLDMYHLRPEHARPGTPLACEEVENATAKPRGEVEDFLSTVAA
jgi:PAS domain-containing protein